MNNALEICQNLIRIKTDGNNLSEAFAYIEEELSPCGFKCEILPLQNENGEESVSFYAQYGQGEPHLLFVGHVDVVPAGNESQWQHPPFAAIVENNILYGRGSSDMLGGLACFIAAAKQKISQGKVNGKISLILSGDEEHIIVEGAKKLLDFAASKGEKFDFCIVGEPSNPKHLGEQIKIGRRGDIFVQIRSKGYQGHTAYPQLAINPIHNLIDLLSKIKNLTLDHGNKFFEPSGIQITTIDVGNTASNIIPAQAEAGVDIRFNNEHTSQDIIQKIETLVKNTKGEFELTYDVVGESFLTPVSEISESLRKIIFNHTGIMPQYSTGGGTSDARFVKNYCPVLEFGLTSETIHKIDEKASVADIEKLSEIYGDFIENYFA